MKKLFIIIFLLLFIFSANHDLSAFSLNLWRHSEIANKNALFIDASITTLAFQDFQWAFLPVDIRIIYLPPLPLPFSIGIFIKTPYPNLKNFGFRIGYHIDLNNPFLDVFFVYSFDLGFIRNRILEEHNDTPVEIRFYDFRTGVRWIFGKHFGLVVETGFKLESLSAFLSIKLN